MVTKTFDKQTAKFLAVVGENMPELSGDVMQEWIQNPRAVQKALSNAFCPPETTVKQPDLLKRITTVTVPGSQCFVIKDHLKAANVGWTGDNFKRLFLNKVEENVPEAKLAVSQLEHALLDASILAELRDKAEVYFAHIFSLLAKQAHGEDGVLLTNGYMNIFYIRDADGNLWAVHARWRSGFRCWYVEAYSVEFPGRWDDGSQVFSRDS